MAKNSWSDGDVATAALLNDIEDRTIVTCTSSTRPSHVDGSYIYEQDTNRRYHSNGSSWIGRTDDGWTSFSPSWAGVTWGGTETWHYRYVEGDMWVTGTSFVDTGTFSISAAVQLTLPNSDAVTTGLGGVAPGSCAFVDVSATSNSEPGTVLLASGGGDTTATFVFAGSGTLNNSSSPITEATGDYFSATFMVPAA